jgi:ribonuclease III
LRDQECHLLLCDLCALCGEMVMEKERKKTLKTLQKKFHYRFRKLELLDQGLRHKSFAHEDHDSEYLDNERMEFLGDAVLDLVVGHLLMERHPDYTEGDLSKMRASAVNTNRLSQMARDLSLGEYLLLGKGEEMTQGREKNSILAGSLEAVMAAVYLDGGFKKAFKVLSTLFSPYLEAEEKETVQLDFKTKLQEVSQEAFRATPRYLLAKEFGPAHDKVFGVKVVIGKKVAGFASGKSKKEAEQQAARKTLEKLQDRSKRPEE